MGENEDERGKSQPKNMKKRNDRSRRRFPKTFIVNSLKLDL